MRCISCNRNLNDSESTRRVVSTNEFLDMCNKCYSDVSDSIPTISRPDLNPTEPVEDWEKEFWEDETNVESWGDE